MFAKDSSEKAFLCNKFFSTVFSTKISNLVGLHSHSVNPGQLMEISTSQNNVSGFLSALDVNKAPGMDGISARIVEECAEELSCPLTLLINLSFRTSTVPLCGKR